MKSIITYRGIDYEVTITYEMYLLSFLVDEYAMSPEIDEDKFNDSYNYQCEWHINKIRSLTGAVSVLVEAFCNTSQVDEFSGIYYRALIRDI